MSASEIAGKTVVVRNQNLKLNSYQNIDSQPINLFIDRGSLILTLTDANTGSLAKFDSFGYLEDQNCTECASANYLKGNFIINGLLLAGENGDDILKNKLYIHGKLVSLNTFGQPTDQRIQTVKSILGAADWDKLKNRIALDHLFKWGCDAVE